MEIRTEEDSFISHLRPFSMVANLWAKRSLTYQLIRREINQRYKGLYLGVFWSFVNPLFMLAIYTVVFGLILKVRWAQSQSDSLAEFALTLFCGLLVFNIFSECMNRSAFLILQNRNYVQKIVFPLEILPVSTTITALFHGLISLSVLIVAHAIVGKGLHASILLAPIILLPLFFFVLGVSWVLAGLGVYFRDLQQIVAVASTAVFFLTPIIYSIEVVPVRLQHILMLNPLCSIVTNLRRVVLCGDPINWFGWGAWLAVTVFFMLFCYAVFMRLKKGFADVV